MPDVSVSTRPGDDRTFRAELFDDWWTTMTTGQRHDLPTASVWPRGEARLALAHPVPWEDVVVVTAHDAHGRVVGAGSVDVPLRDNRDLVQADLAVPPEHRGRGVGGALLRAVCDLAEERGRTRVLGEVPVPLGADTSRWPGAAATRRWGFTLGVADVRRELPLPLDETATDHLARLRAAALPHARGYRWDVVRGVPSDTDAQALAGLSSRMLTEAPQDDLVVEAEDVDAQRVLAERRRGELLGRTTWTALARRDDGVVAGYSVLQRSAHEPDVLRQEDTLVLPEHRGHRLGILLKLDTLAAALGEGRDASWAGGLRAVRTWNAASNGPMIAVNERMGFRPVEDLHELQADVAVLRAALAGR